mgnify:CR=1 FL=1
MGGTELSERTVEESPSDVFDIADFALLAMVVNVNCHHRNRSFATNNGRLRVGKDAFESSLFAWSVAVVGMKIACVIGEGERKR